jgi:hypothetical protein
MGLAEQLGISEDDANTSGPAHQIRVSYEVGNLVGTAAFTVSDIVDGQHDELWIYLPEDDDESRNGLEKLFGVSADADNYVDVEVLVQAAAVAQTVVFKDAIASKMPTYFTEPVNNKELVDMRSRNSELAILVPHGGFIETGISDNVPGMLQLLDDIGQTVSIWEASGKWGHQETSRRWHITSTQVTSSAFPGLSYLEADAPPCRCMDTARMMRLGCWSAETAAGTPSAPWFASSRSTRRCRGLSRATSHTGSTWRTRIRWTLTAC